MNKHQIRHMVDRFLNWKLPEDFNPDGGISFSRTFKSVTGEMRHEPVGTNLFYVNQAEDMIRHMVEDLPGGDIAGPAFPVEGGLDSPLYAHPGMDLRDYFAAQQLVALGQWIPGWDLYGQALPIDEQCRLRAEYAYAMADAMLKARDK